MIIIDSLKNLVDRNKIKVYAYVIMDNHIHLIWELLVNNGKEQAHSSFMKFTSHEFKKVLIANHPKVLEFFKVENITRKYQFWIRDSLPIILYTPDVINQKMTGRRSAISIIIQLFVYRLLSVWQLNIDFHQQFFTKQELIRPRLCPHKR